MITTTTRATSGILFFVLFIFKISFAQQEADLSNDLLTEEKDSYEEAFYSLNPSSKYRGLPNRGDVVRSLANYTAVKDNLRTEYFFKEGVWYIKHKNGFIAVRPPIGLRVDKVPAKSKKIIGSKGTFYYHFGVFYKVLSGSDKFIVVNPPVGLAVDALPSGYKTEEYKGKKVFVFDKIYYEPLQIGHNRYFYKVCGRK